MSKVSIILVVVMSGIQSMGFAQKSCIATKVLSTPSVVCVQDSTCIGDFFTGAGIIENTTFMKQAGVFSVNAVHRPWDLKISNRDTVCLLPGDVVYDEYSFPTLFDEGFWFVYSSWTFPLDYNYGFLSEKQCTVWCYEE